MSPWRKIMRYYMKREMLITVENVSTHLSFIISQKPSFPAFSLAFWKILAWNSLSHWNDSLVFWTKSSWLQILVENETDNPTKNPHTMKIWRYSDAILIILKYQNLTYILSCLDLFGTFFVFIVIHILNLYCNNL